MQASRQSARTQAHGENTDELIGNRGILRHSQLESIRAFRFSFLFYQQFILMCIIINMLKCILHLHLGAYVIFSLTTENDSNETMTERRVKLCSH